MKSNHQAIQMARVQRWFVAGVSACVALTRLPDQAPGYVISLPLITK